MARSNLYSDNCTTCGTNVPANAGVALPPSSGYSKWIVKCKACAGIVADAKPQVSAVLEGASVVFKPTGFLGGDLFATYRRATEGSKFEPSRKVQIASLDKAGGIVQRLIQGNFAVSMAPELAASIQAQTASLKAGIVEASDRADKVDALLQARGLALFRAAPENDQGHLRGGCQVYSGLDLGKVNADHADAFSMIFSMAWRSSSSKSGHALASLTASRSALAVPAGRLN